MHRASGIVGLVWKEDAFVHREATANVRDQLGGGERGDALRKTRRAELILRFC